MNEKSAKILVSGVAVVFAGSVLAHAALTASTPETKSVPVPGPTVTEENVISSPTPVPGPTVTKKVPGPRVTVRVTVQAANRSYKRKKATSLPRGSVQNQAKAVFGSQYSCVASLISHESGWRVSATNPSSGAYGLPQALPGSKMASAGSDWRTNPTTQLRWMRSYVNSRYGGACSAWSYWTSHHNY